MRTVWEVSSTNWPTLTRTNYGEWAVTMKVMLRAQRLWNAVDKGTNPLGAKSALNSEMTLSSDWRGYILGKILELS